MKHRERRPPAAPGAHWILLIHQLPPKPLYLRAKVRNRLERVGAIPLKNSVYALPRTPESLEDFQWIAQEAVAGGGEAWVCEADFAFGPEPGELVERSRRARKAKLDRARLVGRTWVTRTGVQIDRIASAWLIRRFIDSRARFRFVAAGSSGVAPKELRFDMVGGDFTHEGDRCTFETLVLRLGIADAAIRQIAEIVHDIDLKDGKFSRGDAAGVQQLLLGIVSAHPDDAARIERGRALFDDLYSSFAAVRRDRAGAGRLAAGRKKSR